MSKSFEDLKCPRCRKLMEIEDSSEERILKFIKLLMRNKKLPYSDGLMLKIIDNIVKIHNKSGGKVQIYRRRKNICTQKEE